MSSPLRSGATPADLDHSWSERVRDGDAAAYEAVFRALSEPVVAYVAGIVQSRAVAEELVQDLQLEASITERERAQGSVEVHDEQGEMALAVAIAEAIDSLPGVSVPTSHRRYHAPRSVADPRCSDRRRPSPDD